MQKIFWLFLTTALLSVSGCCTSREDVVASFRQNNPSEGRYYEYILPVNFDILRIMGKAALGDSMGITQTLKKQFGSDPKINSYAYHLEQYEFQVFAKHANYYAKLEDLAGKDGALCQFAYNKDGKHEVGFLVIKAGKIVFREVWSADPVFDDSNWQTGGQTRELHF